jgi:uncharacterized SAM-binding protein YcdF (DUF218 family)
MSLLRGHEMPAEAEGSAVSRRLRWRGPRHVLGWIVLAFVALGVAGIAASFTAFTRAIPVLEPRAVARADGIVVLTGGSQRLADALTLLAEGRGKRLLISGVHQRTGRDEIARNASHLRAMLACCVDLGKSARNTIGNAIEARRWARENGFSSLLVVTSNYHMPRTLGEFAHVLSGVSVQGYPVVSDSVDITQMWTDAGAFRLVVGEYAKFVVSWLRQMVESDPEHSRLPVLVGRQKPLGPLPIDRADPL